MPRNLAMTPSAASRVRTYSQYSETEHRRRAGLHGIVSAAAPHTEASSSRRRALRWCAKPCLPPLNSGEYPAPRTRSVSEAETEDGESDDDDHHDAVLRMQVCETFDFESRHVQLCKAFGLESKAITAYARRANADRTMMNELLDMFDAAKFAGYVVEVGPHELDTQWKTHEGISGASYVRSPRRWLSAVRFLPRFFTEKFWK